jgi:hypothetical protein
MIRAGQPALSIRVFPGVAEESPSEAIAGNRSIRSGVRDYGVGHER